MRIRHRTPEDDVHIVAIQHAVNHDRPPLSVDELRHNLESMPPDAYHEMVVAEVDGRIVGDAGWNRLVYLKEQGAYWINLLVDPERWGEGIGSALYDYALPRIRERGAARLYAQIRADLPQAEAFATHRGFTPTGHGDRLSRLEVRAAGLERCRAAARRVEESGIGIATLAELGPEDEAVLRAVHRLDDETARDIPMTEEWSSMPFDQWRAYMLGAPGASPHTFWVALAGDRPVGLAVLERRSGKMADNAYTGVDRAYRGSGIARALKLRTVEWAAANDVDYIYTGNDPANGPMLAVNVDLGYQPLPANVEVVKELRDR